jgi:hypothetical protein
MGWFGAPKSKVYDLIGYGAPISSEATDNEQNTAMPVGLDHYPGRRFRLPLSES